MASRIYIDILAPRLDRPIPGRAQRAAALTEAGEATLSRVLSLKLAGLYKPVAQERMRALLAEQNPLAGISLDLVPEEAQGDALARVMDETDGGAKLREAYEELARMEDAIRANFQAFAAEIFGALESRRGEIARTFFSGRDFGRVTAVRPPERTDLRTRPGCRTTLLLETEGGVFYYKPHVCKTDQLYNQLATRFFPELYAGNRTILCERASFVEPVPRAPLASADEADAYYTRMGLLSALFYALGSFDMHRGNIIPHGSIPVPIDLEHMLCWVMPDGELSPVVDMAERPKHAPTGFLLPPLYAGTGPKLGGDDSLFNRNLPRLNGKMVPVDGHEGAYIAGFVGGFRRIMDNADAIVGLLEDAADTPVRAILRPHYVYPKVIRAIPEPEHLRSSDAMNAWLDRIWDALPEPERGLFRELERDALLSLDYPDFYMRIGERTLYRPDCTVASKDWIQHAPLDCAKARIRLLSEALLAECIAALRANLFRKD